MHHLLLAAIILLLCSFFTGSLGVTLVVSTDKGLVKGGNGLHGREWIGIPYADPPVGELRWQPPQPVSNPWNNDTLDASNLLPPYSACYQPFLNSLFNVTEDCLKLNVYSPYVAPAGS